MSNHWYETDLSKAIMAKKYFHENEDFQGFIDRVVGIFSKELQPNIREALLNGEFFPAGRSLYGAGSKGKFKASMSNCYILPSPTDNIEDIYNVNAKMARIFSYGGGCGVNISNLRPKDAKVNNAARTSSGSVSFLELFNTTGNVIGIHGRRAAEMVGLNCEHPDIEEFLKIKQTNHKLEFMNISILFTKPFMDAVKKKEKFKLHFTVKETGEVIEKEIDAAKFFHEFALTQWDWGDPGSIFIDRVRSYNLLSGYDDYKIEISNPCAEFFGNAYNSCLTGDTLVATPTGIRTIQSLVGTSGNILSANRYEKYNTVISKGFKPVYEIKLDNGLSIKATKDHKFWTINGWKELQQLSVGDELRVTTDAFTMPIDDYDETYEMYGWMHGDGWFSSTVGISFNEQDGDYDAMERLLPIFRKEFHAEKIKAIMPSSKKSSKDRVSVQLQVENKAAVNRALELGFVPGKHTEKQFPTTFYSWTLKQQISFVRGLMSADGFILFNPSLDEDAASQYRQIALASSSKKLIQQMQQFLASLGIFSRQYCTSFKEKRKPQYKLVIAKEYAVRYYYIFGFSCARKNEKFNANYGDGKAYKKYTMTPIVEINEIGQAEVFDIIEVNNTNAFYANGIYVHNCNLGSINLYHCVSDPFTKDARINWSKLTKITDTAVRALDEILDYGYELQPLDENRKCIDDWRSIGLGIMGLADMFVALGLRYGSEKSIAAAEAVLHSILEEALRTSCKLAKEKGAFGKFDWEKSKKSPLIQMFPHLWQDIETYGLRNGTLLSIAPTGTLSLLAGGFSGGVEPIYKIAMTRTTHSMEAERKSFTVFAKSVWDLIEHDGLPDTVTVEELRKKYPFLIESHDIDPMERVELQSAIQKYVDNAISSTVNLKESATPEDIEKIYMAAFDKGCKGITVFRDNCKRGSILDVPAPVKKDGIELDSIEVPKRHRVHKVDGATYVEASACIKNMYVTVNHSEDNKIFEIFTNASGGCQANVNTITRLISLLLRAGVKVEAIIGELREAKCQGCQELRKQGKKVSLSCGNAIADALQKAYKELHSTKVTLKEPEKYIKIASKEPVKHVNSLTCPECGEQLKSEGRCFSCPNCGFSKCE